MCMPYTEPESYLCTKKKMLSANAQHINSRPKLYHALCIRVINMH